MKQRIFKFVEPVIVVAVIAAVVMLPSFCLGDEQQKADPKSQPAQESKKTKDELYGRNIYYTHDTKAVEGNAPGKGSDKKTKAVISELTDTLKKITEEDFKISDSLPDDGIILSEIGSKDMPPEFSRRLEGKRKEAFLIFSEGHGRLWIAGNSPDAVRHGVYYYLEQLGCRWFFPNDNWIIIPSLKSIGIKTDELHDPAFRSRSFFGTGGFGGKLPVDSTGTLQGRWVKWMERNRFGGDIRFGGHMGEAFNIKHKSELEKHPEWLAETNGKRNEWSQSVKWCVSNPEFQKFFIDDRLSAFKKIFASPDPDAPHNMTVSVEPADGYGYCECNECRELGSLSDRTFTLANATAKAVSEQYPGRLVNLYAYGNNAAVPNIPLEDNVHVSVIPYGFQRTGMSGDELLKAWGAKKKNNIGLYDYWAIPDWSLSLPVMDYLNVIPGKIRFWHSQHVDSFNGESTASIGSMGIGWYLASKLLWKPDADVKAILDDFYSKSFGSAAPPMKRMLERWAQGFILSGHELGLSYRDISEAYALAKDSSVKKRIDDYAMYLHYLRLWHEYKIAKPGTAEKKKSTRELLSYIWRIYDSSMVQTFRMHQLICNRFEKADEELSQDFPLNNAKASVWAEMKPPAGEEIKTMIADGIAKYKPFGFEPVKYSDKLVPLAATSDTDSGTTESFAMVGNHNFQFWMGKDTPQFEFSLKVAKRGELEQDGDMLTVTAPGGKTVIHRKIPNDGEWHSVMIPNSGEGRYLMHIFDQKIMFNLKIPSNLPFAVTGGFTCPTMSGKVYFHVPKGLRKFALYCPGAVPIKLFDGNGKPVDYTGDNIIVADVAEGQDGQIWSLGNYKSWEPLRALNFPSSFSLTRHGVMIPEEVKMNQDLKHKEK